MTRMVSLRAVLALALLLSLRADPRAADAGPEDAEIGKLAEQTGKLIQSALQGDPDDKAIVKARTAAVLLAAVAQTGPGNPQRATVRDAALQLADTIRKGKLDDARNQAAGLAKLPANDKAKVAAMPLLGKEVSFRESMVYFGPASTGGEKKLLSLGNNAQAKKANALPKKELTDDLLFLAYRAAALAELSQVHDDATVKKDPKKWKKFAEESRKSALELAAAVREQKGDAAWTALNRLNSACYGCHQDFGR